jgi:uncharacterized YigZ family protein
MMFEDTYRSIARPSEGIYKEKGSKFIALAFPVKTEAEVKARLEDIRKQYHNARHHCYAYVLGPDKAAHRFNDDGEPSGTAGRPIYGQLQSMDLTNILLVVVRYFGGTRLGVSGLINAYRTAARDALESSGITTLLIMDEYELTYEYPLMNEVMRVVKDEDLDVTDQDFRLNCRLRFRVRKNSSKMVYERFSNIHGVEIRYLKTI